MIPSIILFFLLASASGEPSDEPNTDVEETPYSAAAPLQEVLEKSPDPSSPFPRFLNLDSLKDIPLVIVQPQTPISLSILSDEDLKTDRIMRLLQSAMARQTGGRHAEARQAKSISLDRLRSMLGLPFNSGFMPRPPSIFPGNGWQQRIRNSLSSMNPFSKPNGFMEQSGSHQYPFFSPYHPAMPSPYGWRSPPQPLHIGEFATAASMGAPSRLSHPSGDFSQFVRNPVNQQYFGPDLATSGSIYAPAHAHFAPGNAHFAPGNAHFAHYAASVPKHKPLFNSVGGLKGASLEISNAFADFAASDEHGPDVTQKFGSVGHAMNTFLQMMGLGPQNGLTADDVNGGFGGGGSWASMDSTPIARSSDFYPGYGNLANLDEMDDFPIFHEDITEAFMNRMNLTEFFKSMKAGEKTPQDVMEKTVKKETPKTKEGESKESAKATTEMPQPVYVPAHPLGEMKTPNTSKDEASAMTKKPENTTESPVTQQPVVNYKVPSMLPTVPPKARIPPVAIYQNFPPPPKEPSVPKSTSEPTKATTTQSPIFKDEGNPNSLINDIVPRQWVPVSNGQNYVEKQPTPIVNVIHNAETPRGLKILEQVLSHKPQPGQVQA